jgi:two-component system NarL family response regulator
VLVVDDHALARQGLIGLLRAAPEIEVVGEAADGRTAVEMVRRLGPDVVTMDVSLPKVDGVEATRIVRREFPEVRVIGLSMFEEGERAEAMRRAGAVSYLSKGGPTSAVLEEIRRCATLPPPSTPAPDVSEKRAPRRQAAGPPAHPRGRRTRR